VAGGRIGQRPRRLAPGEQRTGGQHRRGDRQPARSPPAPSDSQPTSPGPTICPPANTTANNPIPAGHAAGGRLCRTSAVVAATTDRKTLPNSAPEAKAATGWALSTSSSVASASRPFSSASGRPSRWRCSRPAHSQDEAITPAPSKA
jgi:hypothetical protein